MIYAVTFKRLRLVTACSTLAVLLGIAVPYASATNGAYGDGSYGSCGYGTCSITLTSSNTVNADTTPGASTTCSIQSDAVGVTTDSSTGYTLSLIDSTSSNSLTNGSYTIAAISGSQASPATLSANTWGYRVDSAGGFGAGPTSAVSNSSIPSLTFAPVPPSTGSADTIVSSASPADPTVTTSVWYGVCASPTQPSGTYSNTVTYTAVVN